jgi:hypothetical protein
MNSVVKINIIPMYLVVVVGGVVVRLKFNVFLLLHVLHHIWQRDNHFDCMGGCVF